MNKVFQMLVVTILAVGLAGCGAFDGPYSFNSLSNRAWKEDQSQMVGALYASTFAADSPVGELDCSKLPEVVEKSTSYRSIWFPAEFKRGFQKKCAELQQLRIASRNAAEAKATAEKTASSLAEMKAAKAKRLAAKKAARQRAAAVKCECK